MRLKSSQPFHESEHPQYGKSYGFNVLILKDNNYVEYTWWAKDAARNILQAAHVVKEEDFTLELRTGNSKDGKPYTIWLLNGDSYNDWMNKPAPTKEEFVESVNEAIDKVKVADVAGEVVDYESLATRVDELDKRVKFLEEQSGITEDEDIPF
tara:strand:+ start:1233 stop:1691 length:459 start_codon:yes stop_codon:yes gene_type:complete